jgi:hypothetical protein
MSFLRFAKRADRRPMDQVGRAFVWIAGAAAAAACTWLISGSGERPTLHAQGWPQADPDGDGLPNQLEVLLGTAPDRADTDFDGYSDAEEVARKSKPYRSQSIPTASEVSMSMDAYREGSNIHAVVVVYLPDGSVAGKKLAYGTFKGNQLVPVPPYWLGGGNSTTFLPAHDGVGRIIVLDPILNEQTVLARRGFALFATVAQGGGYLAADAVNLTVVSSQVFEQVITSNSWSAIEPELVVGLGVGGVYRPLIGDPGGDPALGEICAQSTIVVGVINGIVTQEVAAADCIGGWDAFCAPGCAGTVGTQIKTIDPGALIGN